MGLMKLCLIFLSLPLFSSGDGMLKKFRQFKVCRQGQCTGLKSNPSAEYLNKLLFSFGSWSNWSPCTKECSTYRSRICRFPFLCGSTVVYEEAFCFHRRPRCEFYFDNYRKQLAGASDYHHSTNEEEENLESVDDEPPRASRGRLGHSEYEEDVAETKPFNVNSFPRTSRGGDGEAESRVNALNRDTCGVARITDRNRRGLTMRILGGQETLKGKWPWQVAILNRHGETFCGGTLISPRWIITAAHCIRRRIQVTIGEHHLHTLEGDEQHFRIETAFIHPNFNPETVDNDIALLLLPEPVVADGGVACLPKESEPLPASGTMCTILGWGKERYNHVFGTKSLHEGRVPLVSTAECRLTYDTSELTSNMFCGGFRNGTVDSCAGDSGGPLLCRKESRWTIYGVTSFGDGCGRVGKFGIYAKVPNYVNWIYKVISATEESINF